jgi:regulator of CtrA degradation
MVMSGQFADGEVAVSFGERLAGSQAFAQLFRDGMALVEETAAYLDGPGRAESRILQRSASLAYATESMRLTTRLMQIASWLLLHRAVKEGEISLAQASKEKMKCKLSVGASADEQTLQLLPERLRKLIERCRQISERVRRLDVNIYAPAPTPEQLLLNNPVERQLGMLKAAFEQDRR